MTPQTAAALRALEQEMRNSFWSDTPTIYEWTDRLAAVLTQEGADIVSGNVTGPLLTPKSVPREVVVAITRRLQANETVSAEDYLALCAYIVDLERRLK